LTMNDNLGRTPMGLLCGRGDVPLNTVQILATKNPKVFLQADDLGCTPLHSACGRGSMEVVSLLKNLFPETARMNCGNGWTPLHCLCARNNDQVPEATVEAVDRLLHRYPLALTMTTEESNHTPLHLACLEGASAAVIELLVKRGPKAVQIVSNHGFTVLHLACQRNDVPDSVLRLLLELFPAACLLLSLFRYSNAWHRCLPLNLAVFQRRSEDMILDVLKATKDNVCALIEYALCPQTTMPLHMRERLGAIITTFVPDFDATASGVALAESIRPHLTNELVKNLLDNQDLQKMLSSDLHIQGLLSGLVRMNSSVHAQYVRDEPSNRVKGVSLMTHMNSSVDCLYLHLQENAELCVREHVVGVAVTAAVTAAVTRRSNRQQQQLPPQQQPEQHLQPYRYTQAVNNRKRKSPG
jgi:hypothetical protein